MLSGAYSFSDEKHWCVVAFAFANDDRPIHRNLVHHAAHGFDSGLVGPVGVAEAHRLGRFNGRLFDDAQKFQTQFDFHQLSRTWTSCNVTRDKARCPRVDCKLALS